MKQIYIVRHGQSEANAAQQVCGQIDSPLTSLGREQAKKAGKDATKYQFDLIVSSPLKRALDTAQIIAHEIGYNPKKILLMEELKERYMGTAEGYSYANAPMMSGNFEAIEQMAGLEPFEAVYTRVQRALALLEYYDADKILVVCHNTLGRMLQAVAKGEEPLSLYHQARLENAVIYPLAKKQ